MADLPDELHPLEEEAGVEDYNAAGGDEEFELDVEDLLDAMEDDAEVGDELDLGDGVDDSVVGEGGDVTGEADQSSASVDPAGSGASTSIDGLIDSINASQRDIATEPAYQTTSRSKDSSILPSLPSSGTGLELDEGEDELEEEESGTVTGGTSLASSLLSSSPLPSLPTTGASSTTATSSTTSASASTGGAEPTKSATATDSTTGTPAKAAKPKKRKGQPKGAGATAGEGGEERPTKQSKVAAPPPEAERLPPFHVTTIRRILQTILAPIPSSRLPSILPAVYSELGQKWLNEVIQEAKKVRNASIPMPTATPLSTLDPTTTTAATPATTSSSDPSAATAAATTTTTTHTIDPIKPSHLREAYRRLIQFGTIPTPSKKLLSTDAIVGVNTVGGEDTQGGTIGRVKRRVAWRY